MILPLLKIINQSTVIVSQSARALFITIEETKKSCVGGVRLMIAEPQVYWREENAY